MYYILSFFFCILSPIQLFATEPINITFRNDKQLIVINGDIFASGCNAIVNAANQYLNDGGGICGAIFEKAGTQKLREKCRAALEQEKVDSIPVGQAIITDSCQLKSLPSGIDYIIHAVGPIYNSSINIDTQNALLSSAYNSALRLASEKKLSTLAFSFLSAGIFGYPISIAANVALRTICNFLSSQETSLLRVYIYTFPRTPTEFKAFKSVISKWKHELEDFGIASLSNVNSEDRPTRASSTRVYMTETAITTNGKDEISCDSAASENSGILAKIKSFFKYY